MLVFISYAHEDSALVDEVSQRLSAAGLEVFRDTKNIPWGGQVSADVQKALEQAGGVVVVVSPASVKSQWVPYEIGYATALRKPVLPFLTHPSIDLPAYLADRRHISKLEEIGAFIGQVRATGRASIPAVGAELSEAARIATLISELPPEMSSLLSEIRSSLEGDETGLVMEFVVLANRRIGFTYYKKSFRYYEEDHPDLRLMVDQLLDRNLVVALNTGNAPIYRMTPAFAAALRGQQLQEGPANPPPAPAG